MIYCGRCAKRSSNTFEENYPKLKVSSIISFKICYIGKSCTGKKGWNCNWGKIGVVEEVHKVKFPKVGRRILISLLLKAILLTPYLLKNSLLQKISQLKTLLSIKMLDSQNFQIFSHFIWWLLNGIDWGVSWDVIIRHFNNGRHLDTPCCYLQLFERWPFILT